MISQLQVSNLGHSIIAANQGRLLAHFINDYSKSKLSISLFVKKGHYPIVKIYFGKESEEEIRTPWNKFPDIIFE